MGIREEIVKVLDNETLHDSAGDEYRYTTKDGHSLAPGYYIVLWPAEIEAPRYDENATYYGPFILPRQAAHLLSHYIEEYATKNLRRAERAPRSRGTPTVR